MNFTVTEEMRLIIETVRNFAEDRLEPVTDKMDKEDFWPENLFKEFGALGLLAPTVSEDYGGANTDYLVQTLILEELAKVSPAFALSIGAHSNLSLDNLNRNGNSEQKGKYLPELVTGQKTASMCLTEPSTGSDAFGLKSTALIDGDFYLLNGAKTFITNAPIADTAIVYAKSKPELGVRGISAFVIELNAKGVTRGKPMEKMGMRGSLTGELFFEDVEIPKDNLLGEEGGGRKIAKTGLSSERAVLAGISLGICERVSELALSYALGRVQFDKKIAEHQLIMDKIARMYTETNASKLLTYWAADAIGKNHRANKEAAAAIMYSAEKSTQLALDAIQILGGYGYMKEYKVERFMRDAKLLEIGAGTTEMRKIIIAQDVISNRSFHFNRL